jgi:hypothetical protein
MRGAKCWKPEGPPGLRRRETWDFAFADVVDPAAVGAYVAEAVARNGEYMANRQEVLDASRAAARARRQPKARREDGAGVSRDIG